MLHTLLTTAALLAPQTPTSTAAAALPVTFVGRVFDENGTPLAGAGLTLGPPEQVTVDDALDRPLARTGDDGTFELRTTIDVPAALTEPPPAVLLAAPGKAALRFHCWEVRRATDPVRLDMGTLVLLPGVTLIGRTRDASGALAGVRVQAADLLIGRHQGAMEGQHFSATTSDARGIFTLRGVPSAGLSVVLFKPGYFEVHRSPVDRQTPLDVTLAPSEFTTGRVVDGAGRPCRTWLTASYEAEVECATGVATDADGRFRLPIAAPTRYRLRATGASGELVSTILAGPADDVVVGPDPGADTRRVSLRVVADADGAPIGRFEVRASPGLESLVSLPTMLAIHLPERPRLAGKDGEFEVAVPTSRPTTALVRAPGWQAAAVVLNANDAGAPVEVRLRPESAVEGILRDSAGKPIAGARLCALQVDRSRVTHGSMPDDGARSDEEGRFRIGGLGPGAHAVHVVAPEVAASKSFPVELGAAETKTVEFVLPPACCVVGRLKTTENDVPLGTIARLQHTPVWADNASHLSVHRDLWAPVLGGTFRIEHVDPGQYDVELLLPRRQRMGGLHQIRVATIDVAHDTEATLHIDLDFVLLQGQVELGELGAFATQLALLVEPPRRQGPLVRPLPARGALLAPDGSFAFAVPPGTYRMVVVDVTDGLRLFEDDEITVQPGTPVRRDLAPPLRRVHVALRPAPGEDRTTVDDVLVSLADEQPFSPEFSMSLLRCQRGLDVQPGDTECWFLAPPGTCTVKAQSRTGFLRASSPWAWTQLGVATVNVGRQDVSVALRLEPLASTASLLADR